MNKHFIIPQLKSSLIAKVIDEKVKIIQTIDIPYKSICRFTKNNLIVSQCTDINEFRIYDSEAKLIHKKEDCNYRALAVKDNTVYLGGEYTITDNKRDHGEMFSIINLECTSYELLNQDLPIKVVRGKSIDDILVRCNQLFLVDNIIYPKYLLRYDITIPDKPKHLQTVQLPRNGTYEHIIKGDINKDYMVIFSLTFGRNGGARHIRISGKTEGYLSMHIPFDKKFETIPDFFKDICLKDDYLIILKTEGIGIISLNQEISDENIRTINTNTPTFDKLIKTPNNDVIGVNENNFELINVC
jgi:hypothetical protein